MSSGIVGESSSFANDFQTSRNLFIPFIPFNSIMKISIKRGISFGLTSGVITTLGLIVGLDSSTNSKLAVLGGIFVIAIADALSDSLGMHLSVESEHNSTAHQIWESTFATFFSKLVIALTFAIPVLLFSLGTAIIINIIWGLFLIAAFSWYIANKKGFQPLHAILEHVIITIVVITISYFVGKLVAVIAGA